MSKFLTYILLIITLISCTSETVIDQQWLEQNYTKKEAMVQMRDSVSLYTSVYEPIGATDRPVLIVRTPYSCAPYGSGWKGDLTEYMQEFLKNNYIIVFQDVRGRYMSEGEYLNIRPYIRTKPPHSSQVFLSSSTQKDLHIRQPSESTLSEDLSIIRIINNGT